MKALMVAAGIAGDTPDLAGGDMRFIEIAKQWSEMGVEVHVCSPRGGAYLCNALGLNFTFHKIPKSGLDGRLHTVLDAFLLPFRIPSSVWNFDGEVVYSVNEQLYDVIPALLLKLRRGGKIRWATVVHWLPPFPPWKRKNSKLVHSVLFSLSERLSVLIANRFADALLPVSATTGEQLRQAGAHMPKVHVVECGVPLQTIEAVIKKTQHKEKVYDAVFMKRIQASKGAFDLVDIWEKVLRAKPDARLLVVGEGADGKRLREIVSEKGLSDRITFAGAVYDFEEKFSLLSQSRVFILPSYEENWAIVIGEAMACGVPVVSYGLHELVEVWQDKFVQVSIGDTDRFAEAILELVENDTKRREMAEEGCRFVRRLDWKEIAKRELHAITYEEN